MFSCKVSNEDLSYPHDVPTLRLDELHLGEKEWEREGATAPQRKNGSLHLSSYSLFRSGEQKRIQTFFSSVRSSLLSVFGGERRPVSIFSGHYIRRSYEALRSPHAQRVAKKEEGTRVGGDAFYVLSQLCWKLF